MTIDMSEDIILRAEQSRAEQSRAEQRLICNRCNEIYNGILRYSDSYVNVHIPQNLRIRSEGTERHSALN